MTYSMTGFARCENSVEGVSLAWELRTVNHRYLDVSFRLPEDFRVLETGFREIIGKKLSRGKLDCALRVRSDRDVAPDFTLNRALSDKVINVAQEIAGQMANPTPLNPIHVLRWPGVVSEAERDWAPIHSSAVVLLEQTLGELETARSNEGIRLRDMLLERCNEITKIVDLVGGRLPVVRDQIRTKILSKVEQLKADPDMDRIEQELVILAQKMDVAEELDRIGSHVKEVRKVLDRSEPMGRRLDFLMQEFNREANTLASKSQDSECTRLAVDLKVLIEQMREQVQNIE